MKSKKHIVFDQTIMWFGKYKGFKLIDIPNEYFQYLLDNNISFRGIKNYSKTRLNLKKMETIKKKCQIIMLSVNEKAIGSEFTIGKRIKTIEKTPDKLVYGCALSDITFQRQHLYIISNDEIKEEDFFMSAFMSYSLHNVKEGYAEYPDTTNCKKIIATTDKTLGLPQIPKEFIEAYILSYNMGSMNTITEIMVEYEEIISYSSKKVDHYKLKIDENNCISITAVKTNYSKEEVKSLLHNLAGEMHKQGIIFNPDSTEKWIEKNLQ